MKTTFLNSCLLAVALVTASSAPAAGLINGNFETPAIGFVTNFVTAPTGFGWTIATGSIDLSGTYWQASSGNQSIDLNGGTTGAIYQDFTFSSSQTWAITFDLSANPDASSRGDGGGIGIKNVRVDFGIPGLMTTLGTYGVDSAPRTISNMQYVGITTPSILVSDSVLYRLQFTSLAAGTGGPVLDNIQLQVVPEPSANAIIACGLAGFLAFRRSRCSMVGCSR